MIDLRSDTVTRPTAEMRAAMAQAPVGDDVYGEDPTVRALEGRIADLLGKEAAVFVPSGTMSNQVALRVHTQSGDTVLMDGDAHMVLNEVGASGVLSGVTIRALRSHGGVFGADAVRAMVEPPHAFTPAHIAARVSLVCLENTHNVGGGVVWPLGTVQEVADAARSMGVALHMDGARLFHAAEASGVPERAYAAPMDTVSVCFSKGLGAPVGSALAGTAATVERARRFKQMFGGGFRQAGILAAGALYALDHHRGRLGEDIENARLLAQGLAKMPGVRIDPAGVATNIVRFQLQTMTAGVFVGACHDDGVHMLPAGPRGVRAVTHLDVCREDVLRALEIVRRVVSRGAG